MKKAALLILVLLITTHSFSQTSSEKTTYYKSNNNKIYSVHEYADIKKQIISEFKKINKSVRIKENFGILEEKGDSIIQHYKFRVIPLFSDGKMKESIKPTREKLISKKLPHTILKNIDGSNLDVNDLKGKPTMINFWFTSCMPCIDEFPALNRIKEKYSDKVNFISITFDDKDKVVKLNDRYNFDFDKYINAKEYINKLNIGAYPTSLFIDKNGIVKYAEGGIPYIIKDGKRSIGDGKEFEDIINKLLD